MAVRTSGRRGGAAVTLLMLLVSSLALPLVGGQVASAGCDVRPGMRIQDALDTAPLRGRIVVCAGIYREALRIDRGHVTLEGRPGAVLDGSLLVGTRHAFHLAAGVESLTVRGFEIRHYDDPLRDRDDPSGALVAMGGTRDVRFEGNHVHDNAWAGLLVARGTADRWVVEGNRFEGHGLAHVVVLDAARLTVRDNRFGAAPYGLVLADVRRATVEDNALAGGGAAALMVLPALDLGRRSVLVEVERNVVRGAWGHGLWALELGRSVVRDNVFAVGGSGLTLGGASREVTAVGNVLDVATETRRAHGAEALLAARAAASGPRASDVESAPCWTPRCGWAALAAWFDGRLPTASAQKPAPPPSPCRYLDGFACADFGGLLADLTGEQLAPLTSSTGADYAERLRACEGRSDDCLRSAFIQDGDPLPPRTWTVPVEDDANLGNAVLRFVDVAVVRDGEARGRRLAHDDLDQAWTVLVLCRMLVAGSPTSCLSAPRAFDFGLDVSWAESPWARHVSAWRLFAPSDGTHAAFDRIHAADVTLFHATVRPHHAHDPPVDGGGDDLPPPDPLRVEYAGSARLACDILAASVANGDEAARLRHDCRWPELVREPEPLSFLWCAESLLERAAPLHRSEAVHATRAAESAAGLWSWSASCGEAAAPQRANWTTFYTADDRDALADAQRDHYAATADVARSRAASRAENVTLAAAGRHLALLAPGQGLPRTLDPGLPGGAGDHDVVLLDWESDGRANLRLAGVDVADAERGWVPATVAGLVAFTPVRLRFEVAYHGLNGEPWEGRFEVELADEDAFVMGDPVAVTYAGETVGNVVAWDPDARDPARRFASGGAPHAFPLVEVTAGGQRVGAGLVQAGFRVPEGTTDVTACVRELWTGRSDGSAVNLDLDRLTYEAAADARCALFRDLDAVLLRTFQHQLVTLELRAGSGDGYVAEFQGFGARFDLIGDPTHPVPLPGGESAGPTLEEALARAPSTPHAEAVRGGAIRLVVETPAALSGAERAAALADLLRVMRGAVDVVAVGWEEVPLTAGLARALEEAVDGFGLVVLAPAGTLPAPAWGLAPPDKLMTLSGLAASPKVLTVGAAVRDPAGPGTLGPHASALRVAPWSRLGPTPDQLAPKPDFLAPSPTGTTLGALWNVVPFVSALVLLGIGDVDMVRALLAALAVPTRAESGAPATFWEQGFGALDLGAFLELPGTPEALVALVAERLDEPVDDVWAATARSMNTTRDALEGDPAATPAALLGAAAPLEELLRSALARTLLHLVVDSPALPANAGVDFGVVNRETAGAARFTPLDFDSLLNATFEWLEGLLRAAGYPLEVVTNLTAPLLELVEMRAASGQDVTLNATHAYFFDTARYDFLYSAYLHLARGAAEDARGMTGAWSVPVDEAALAGLEAALGPWELPARHLTAEARGTTRLPVERGCPTVDVRGLLRMADAVAVVLEREAAALAPTPKGADLPSSAAFASPALRTFAQGQVDQATCLGDALALLDYLRARAQALRAVQSSPWGALGATEAWLGTWDETVLGGQVGATLDAAGVGAGEAAGRNASLALDAVLEIVDRTAALLREAVAHAGTATLVAKDPEGPQGLVTLPERTAANPLGLYVGWATMRSHDVTVWNPFTGEPVVTRSVTVPVPSVLWNNPTLVVDAAFRDTTPLAGALALLHEPEPRVFENVTVDPVVVQDGVLVPLVPHARLALQREEAGLRDALERVLAAARDLVCPGASGPPAAALPPDLAARLGDDACPHLEALRADLMERWAAVAALLDLPDGQLERERALRPGVDAHVLMERLMDALVSRLHYQMGSTDGDGRARLGNLYPGRYQLFMPYAYPMATSLDEPSARRASGGGALAGPMVDADRDLAEFVDAFERGLPVHPSAPLESAPWGPPAERANVTAACGWSDPARPNPPGERLCDYLPWFEVNNQRYPEFLHPFSLRVAGPDLPAVGCLEALRFGQATGTPLRFPGCGAPSLDASPALDALRRLLGLGACLLGDEGAAAGEADAARCQAFADAVRAAQLRCLAERRALDGGEGAQEPLSCVSEAALEDLVAALRALVERLEPLAGPSGLFLPWFHSPVRVVEDDPAAFGFTVEGLLPATRAWNAGSGADNDTLRRAIERVLANLTGHLLGAVRVTEPPVESTLEVTHPQGILHRVTDRVGGLDWFHLDATASLDAPSAAAVEQQLRAAAAMVVDPDDAALLGAFADRATGADGPGAEGLQAAYDEGLRNAWGGKRDLLRSGWIANGTLTAQGLALAPSGQDATSRSPWEVCEAASRLSGVPAAYFTCPTLSSAGARTSLRGAGGVDVVQFTNALLDRLRRDPGYADGPDRAERIAARVREAAALSTTSADETWSRTSEAIRFEKDAAEPSVGLLLYSTPVPVQEFMRVRFEADVLAENTAVLLVATSERAVVEGLVAATGALADLPLGDLERSVSFASDDLDGGAGRRALGAAENATLAVSHHAAEEVRRALWSALGVVDGKHAVLHAQLLGVPVGVGATANEEVGVTDHCVACGGSFLYAQPDGHHRLRRTHEFNTKAAGLGPFGAEALHVALLYFPTVTTTRDAPWHQKLLVSNVTLQLSTFLGWPNHAGRDEHAFELEFPLRYRANVEEWSMLYAAPDQEPAADGSGGLPVDLGAGGLRATFAMRDDASTAWTAGREDLLRSLSVRRWESSCSETVAPGYPTTGFVEHPRTVPSTGLFDASANRCGTDRIVALRPEPVVDGRCPPVWTTSVPEKSVRDALGYQFQVAWPGLRLHAEEFTQCSQWSWGGYHCAPALCHELFTLDGEPLVSALPVDPAGVAGRVALDGLDAAARTATGVAGAVRGFLPVLLRSEVCACIYVSFLPGAQHGQGAPLLGPEPVHQYVVLDGARARALMGADPWSPERTVVARDESDPARAAAVHVPNATLLRGQPLDTRQELEYKSLVAAYGYGARSVQRGDAAEARQDLEQTVEVLLGNGVTGTGFALRLRATQEALVADGDRTRVTEGLRAGSAATLAATIYRLGGAKVAGSDCSAVPTYAAVRPHFRCTGYDFAAAGMGLGGSAAPTACTGAGLGLLAAAQERVLRHLDESPGRVLWTVEPLPFVVQSLAEGPEAPPAGTTDVGERALGVALEREAALGVAAAAGNLVGCLAFSAGGGAAPGFGASAHGLAEYADAFRDALHVTLDGDMGAAGEAIAESVRTLHADLAEGGEPQRLVGAALEVSDDLRTRLGVNRLGPFAVNYTVEEWSSRVADASLTVRVTRDGTTVESRLEPPAEDGADPVSPVAALPAGRSHAAVVSDGSALWVFGGKGPSGVASSILRVDGASGAVRTMNASFARWGAAAAFDGARYVYLFGGCPTVACASGSSSVMRYDPVADKVEARGFLPAARVQAHAFLVEGAAPAEILLVGGRLCAASGCGANGNVIRYDVAAAKGSWAGGAAGPALYGAASAGDGRTAYMLGGCGAAACPSDGIVRVDLRARTFTTLAPRLAAPLADGSAAWAGPSLFTFGGSTADGVVQRFTPAAGTVTRLGATLPAGLTGIGAGVVGGRALVVGGALPDGSVRADVLAYDPARDPLGTGFLRVGPEGGLVLVPLEEGADVEVSLRVTDEFGNAFGDDLAFRSETRPPLVATGLPADLFAGAPLGLAWTVSDAGTGVHAVRLERRAADGTWAPWGAEAWLHAGPEAPPAEVPFAAALRAEDLAVPSGTRYELRLVAEDRAGNVAVSLHNLTVDRTPPDVWGAFPDAVDGLLRLPPLRSTFGASDAHSGLAEASVVLRNATTGEETPLWSNASLDGGPTMPDGVAETRPWLDAAYDLVVRARDGAGNEADAVVANVRVLVPPTLAPLLPGFVEQDAEGALRLAAHVSFPDYAGVRSDVTLRAVRVADGATVFEAQRPGSLGDVTAPWTVPAQPGRFRVEVVAARGEASATVSALVDVAPRFQGYPNVTRGATYGDLGGGSDLYRYVHPVECGTWVRFTLSSPGGSDVDLHVAPGDPALNGYDLGRYGPQLRSRGEGQGAEPASHRIDGVVPGDVFSLLVRKPGGGAGGDYLVLMERPCTTPQPLGP